jgi:hypothetical protein
MAATVPLINMVDSRFPIVECDGRTRERECTAVRLGPQGIEFLTEAVPSGRFAWLVFTIPGSAYRVKALGEVMAVIGGDGPSRVIMRFKHVFPRDRAAMDRFLAPCAAA